MPGEQLSRASHGTLPATGGDTQGLVDRISESIRRTKRDEGNLPRQAAQDALPASFSGQHLADRIAQCPRPVPELYDSDGVSAFAMQIISAIALPMRAKSPFSKTT